MAPLSLINSTRKNIPAHPPDCLLNLDPVKKMESFRNARASSIASVGISGRIDYQPTEPSPTSSRAEFVEHLASLCQVVTCMRLKGVDAFVRSRISAGSANNRTWSASRGQFRVTKHMVRADTAIAH